MPFSDITCNYIKFLQIRRDPRISWIAKPVHKRREARGLTAIGKKVGQRLPLSLGIYVYTSSRTVVSAKATVTTTPPSGPPGGSTTLFRCVVTGKGACFCLFVMYAIQKVFFVTFYLYGQHTLSAIHVSAFMPIPNTALPLVNGSKMFWYLSR